MNDNTFILALRRDDGRKATRGMRLAARAIKFFNRHNRRFALKFKRDDLNRYFGIKYSRFDPNENLLQGGMVTVEQAVNIYHLLSQVLVMDVPGDVVELGCHAGTTAIVLRKTLDQLGADRRLHVYDSFEGLPAKSPEDGVTRFEPGDCRTTEEALVENFQRAGAELPVVHRGWFEDTLPRELPREICFAHVDGDFYRSVRESLEQLYPRLARDAIVVVDDYCDPARHDVNNILPGVKTACDEFLQDKPEQMTVLVAGAGAHAFFRKH